MSPLRIPTFAVPAVLAVLAAFAVPASASAATLYISPSGSDSSPCTAGRPCASFARAYRAASAGSEVIVAGGTYGSQTFSHIPAKAGRERIVFRPAAGASVTIGGLSVAGSHNIEVRDMRATGGWGVTDMGSNVVYRNIVVKDVDEAGGYLSGSTDVQILGGEIGRVDPDDGIHMNAADGQNTNVLIDGLYMHDLTRDLDPSAHDDCIQTGSAINLTIRNSRFVRCGTQGIFLNPYGGGETRNITIENNWFGSAQLGYNALYVGDAAGVTVRNNSFVHGVYVDSSASNTAMVGNILAGTDGHNCSVLADHAVVFSHNLSTGECDGARGHTVAPGARNDFVQPSSADASVFDLHLRKGAKAIDRGDPSNYTRTDFDGNPRPTGGRPDAGAIEFGSGRPGASPPNGPTAKRPPRARRAISRVRLRGKRICRGARKRCRARVIVTLSRPARLKVRVWPLGVKPPHPAMVRRRAGRDGRNVIVLPGHRLRRGRYRIVVTADFVKAPRRLHLRVG